MSFRIAFIGAGSIEFTRKLVADLLTVPEFDDVELAFTDIDRRNLGMVAELCRRDIAHNGRGARIVETTDRRAALTGARYVFCVVRVGGLDAFRTDIEIPLKYGVDQCVGDTLCAGGLMYAQRGIAAILEFCKDIREVAEPDCLLLNYANPMAMLTWAANVHGNVRCVGLCHGVQHGEQQIAELLGIKHEELTCVCAGINHQTWFVDIRAKGRVVDGAELLAAFERHPIFSRTEKCRIDVLRRFGVYSTESNGHLSEYLMWYRKRPSEIGRWCDLETWILGETGGYLRVCSEGRDWFKKEFKHGAAGHPPLTYSSECRSEEHGSFILEALETGRTYSGHFNLPNLNAIPNLPSDAIIEGPGYVDENGIQMLSVGELPLGCAAVCNQSISVQRMGVRAAVTGDVELLKQAMLLDPLVGAVCNPPEVWRMTDELLAAQAKWLPQYRTAMAGVRRRLKTEPAIKTRPSPGYRPSAAELARRARAKRTKDRSTR